MKKIITMLVVGILVLTGLEAFAISNYKQSNMSRDELDQSMTQYEGVLPLGSTNILGYYANLSVAQSIIPQMHTQTKAQFLMARNATAQYPCCLAIRDNLTNEDLSLISVEPNEFPLVNGTPTEEQLGWVEFDFPDVIVIPNQTYYLVMYTTNLTENYYWVSGNGTNVYPNGQVFVSIDDGITWIEDLGSINFTNADACFKTYGIINQAPSIPTISGKTTGKAGKTYTYTFNVTDPEKDDIFYFINWSDGTPEAWIGPYISGVEVTLNHTWSTKGTYEIKAKAKDIYGVEGNWSEPFPVKIPRDKAIYYPILRYFEAHPLLLKILKLFFNQLRV